MVRNYLGASADELVCQAKSPGESELWAVNMAARPQVPPSPPTMGQL